MYFLLSEGFITYDEEIHEIFRRIDFDNDGKINFTDFSKLFNAIYNNQDYTNEV